MARRPKESGLPRIDRLQGVLVHSNPEERRTMKIAYTVEDVKSQVRQWKKEGLTVGLVPTMGYLHEGHESLIKRAVAENDRVVVSVFLNPTQFAPNEDLASYPRDFEADTKLCEGAGAALVFHPEPSEMYAEDACTFVDMTAVTKELCGKSRPIHFRGVCTVVNKLMNISMADRAYFGQKDAQQLAVIRRMVRDLNMNVEVVGCPIIREADGLAKSSRNTYLSEEERKAGLVLSQAVKLGQKLVAEGEKSAAAVTGAMSELISAEPLAKIDYVSMVSWDSIEPVETIEGPVLVAMAVYIGKTRLIDNFIYEG
jgi:pantoate--beta-alanine ligase